MPKASQPKPESSVDQPRKWRAANAGKRWQLTFFRMVIRVFGRRPAYYIMYIVVFWYVLFSRSIRRSTRPYLDRRFPRRTGLAARFLDSYRMLCSFGRALIDQAAVAAVGPSALNAVCEHEERLREVASGDGGVVLVNAHVGVWPIAVSALDHVDKKVSVVMIPPDPDSPIAGVADSAMPFSIIDPRNGLDSVLEMMRSLRDGEILGLMADRVFGAEEGVVTARFLGDEIKLPFSPYRLAGATGAPIVVLLSAKVGYRKYVIQAAGIIRVQPEHARSSEACRPYAQQFADILEAFVREHPWQFFNFFDLWKNAPA